MKTTLDQQAGAEVKPLEAGGRTYWRGLEELSQTPEFRTWVEREFPAGASELDDGFSRRHFVKIMSASFMLAGLGLGASGCRRPVQNILPFGKMPENYLHGVPQNFATAMPSPGGTIPLVVKSTDGRPIKIEGNSLHPDSNGGTDRYAQASILNLYDPDRAMQVKQSGRTATAEAAADFLARLSRQAQANSGQGLAFLAERSESPSRQRLQKEISAKYPQAKWFTHSAADFDVHRRAATEAFGKSVRPYYLYDKADVIVSLDCDFLGVEADLASSIRRFAKRRHIETPNDVFNRLYIIESLMTLTGFNADHRLRLPAGAVGLAAAALASAIVPGGEIAGLDTMPKPQAAQTKWLEECAKDLAAHRGNSLVVAGYRQPFAVHLLAHALNAALGNIGKTVVYYEVPGSSDAGLPELSQALNANQVETLVILDANPAYTAPADLDWAKAQRKAKTVVRLGYYDDDETSSLCDWQIPAAHYLESWGDSRTSDGTLVPIQPLIAPLFGGMTDLEFLARVGGLDKTDPYVIVRETFAGIVGGGDAEAKWRKFLHDGFLADSAAKPAEVQLSNQAVAKSLPPPPYSAPTKEKLEVVFYRDYSVDDGRYANNGWLQEMPDPVTKIVWDNVVLLSRKTAADLGVQNKDLVEIKLGNATVRGPVWIQPGQADYSLGLALGYGRAKSGRVGHDSGFNVYPLRTANTQTIAGGASLSRVSGKVYPIATTQSHWSLEGRPIIREANLKEFREKPAFAKSMGKEGNIPEEPLYPNPFDKLKQKGLHQWGMAIDLNMCVGCSTCMMACQSENNVPIVGKDQVSRGREMHWIRIDRYYAGHAFKPKNSSEANEQILATYEGDGSEQFASWIDDPQTVTQPMLCQHCEAAPCESVCPVNATSHDQEGLNVMTYNRCVGTRYCSNNCPYKVRRFNFFDFNKRPLNKLRMGPLAHRPEIELELVKMVKNPDVTVRMRGVMEKCTYCLQRIEQAKIKQKTQAGASGDVVVPTDSFTTACAQACPADAIVFGNLNDSESRVSKLKRLDRNYSVLEALLTKPRTTYLARVRNPNPAMPDYQAKGPFTLQEFDERNEDPFESSEVAEPVSEGKKKSE